MAPPVITLLFMPELYVLPPSDPASIHVSAQLMSQMDFSHPTRQFTRRPI